MSSMRRQSQEFDSQTSIFFKECSIFNLPLKPAEVKVRSENGPPNSHVGGVDFYWSGFQSHLFLLTQTVTLPFALFFETAIVSVHVKIRRQELQSIRRTRYSLEAYPPVQDIVRSLLDRTSWVKSNFIYAAS